MRNDSYRRREVRAVTDADPTKLKRGVRDAYDQAAERYARFIAPSFVPIADRLLRLAAWRPGERHLDLATGTGLLIALTDRLTGAGVHTAGLQVGLDQSAAMLRRAREASPASRHVQADLERLPFSAASFDLATLSLALHHLPDPLAALAEARRVLRPGGRLAVAAWGAEPSSLWRAFDAWSERVGLDEPRVVGPRAATLNTPERLRATLVAAGFPSTDVTVERPSLRYPDLDAFWEWRTSFPATFRVVGALPGEELDRLRAHCLVDLVQLVGVGPVRADQDVLFVVAR